MIRSTAALTLTLLALSCQAPREKRDYPCRPVPFTGVHCRDDFWLPRIETNRRITIPYAFDKCEETRRIANFAVAGGLEKGKFEGIYFNDSDVYKLLEGAAYALHNYPDPVLERRVEEVIAKIAAAQEEDGYLYTCRTIDPENPPRGAGPERWCNLAWSHELYNVGHLYEAALAHYRATGRRSLLEVALKNADLVCRVFGPGKDQLHHVPGHQEIEIGLVKLYRLTGGEKYLRLARYFLDQRGRADRRELYDVVGGTHYTQDHKPVVEQEEPVGHAVRAGYMYSAMADIAALTGDRAYLEAIDRLWRSVAGAHLYVTGGIGARRHGEAFGEPYRLPNLTAYCETCAAVANMLWNQRLFLLHGDGRYVDVLERSLYNNFLAGISLGGKEFFYPNPLASDGRHARSPWFSCSCCPVNVTRFMPSLPGYVYAVRGEELFVNLYVGGRGEIDLAGGKVTIRQRTEYPWQEKVDLTVDPGAPRRFVLRLRIPGWARNEPLPGGLYSFMDKHDEQPVVKVNGETMPLAIDRGYQVIRRRWRRGDRVELELPMPVRLVQADERVAADRGRFCLQRGPLIYAAEWVDNGGRVSHLVPDREAGFRPARRPDLLGGVTLLRGRATALHGREGGEVERRSREFTAIPYYAWAHRGKGEMRVWLPLTAARADPLPPPTIASRSRTAASYVCDVLGAVNDQVEPRHSNDHTLPRLTFWAHKGTGEWVRYTFAEPARVAGVQVYWFDDRARKGGCRVPAAWRVLYRDPASGEWRPVKGCREYPVVKDGWSRATFEPVRTGALRLEIQLQPDFSGGILEWRVLPAKEEKRR